MKKRDEKYKLKKVTTKPNQVVKDPFKLSNKDILKKVRDQMKEVEEDDGEDNADGDVGANKNDQM